MRTGSFVCARHVHDALNKIRVSRARVLASRSEGPAGPIFFIFLLYDHASTMFVDSRQNSPMFCDIERSAHDMQTMFSFYVQAADLHVALGSMGIGMIYEHKHTLSLPQPSHLLAKARPQSKPRSLGTSYCPGLHLRFEPQLSDSDYASNRSSGIRLIQNRLLPMGLMLATSWQFTKPYDRLETSYWWTIPILRYTCYR